MSGDAFNNLEFRGKQMLEDHIEDIGEVLEYLKPLLGQKDIEEIYRAIEKYKNEATKLYDRFKNLGPVIHGIEMYASGDWELKYLIEVWEDGDYQQR